MSSRTYRIIIAAIIVILAFICTALFIFEKSIDVSADTVNDNINDDNISSDETSDGTFEYNEDDVIYSYKDVFREYYNYAVDTDSSVADRCSFDEFIIEYYDNNLTIYDYTAAVISNDINLLSSSSSRENFLGGGVNGTDAFYILKSSNSEEKSSDVTPATDFAWEPMYFSLDFSAVFEGCIAYESITDLGTGHTAFIYNTSKNSDYGTYIQTIEAVEGGVQFGYLDDARMLDFGVIILGVKGGTSDTISLAKAFCLAQIGKPYNLQLNGVHTSIDSESWYCSELIYAAYMSGGVDISGSEKTNTNLISPAELYESDATMTLYSYTNEVLSTFLKIVVNSSTWFHCSITITNNTYYDRDVEYNSKLCNSKDAMDWSGLSDIVAISIPAKSSVTLTISTNWFADYVTVGFISYGYRFITYATDVDQSEISVGHSVVKV